MSVYERLGGAAGIRALVVELSARVGDDPVLGPMFDGVDGSTLEEHRADYFAAVLGGPERYTGRSMRDAHRPLRLTDHHVDLFRTALGDSLAAIGADAETTAELHALLEGLRPVLVSPTRGE